MSGSRRRTTCRLCERGPLELALALKPTPIADAYAKPERAPAAPDPVYPLDLALCAACGHLQLFDTVDPKLLFSDYTFVTTSSLGLVQHFTRQVERVADLAKPAPGALVVDIGSNDGSLLKIWQQRGQSALGVDPAAEIARRATEAGVETVPEFFTSALGRRLAEQRGRAAVISANNVYAHVDGLADMTDGIRELLADDGVFVFEVSYLPDIVDRMLFDTVYHEHLCYHSLTPLRAFFAAHGLELFDAERIPTKGGSIRGFVQRAGGPHFVSPAVDELCAMEDKRGFRKLQTFAAFGRRIEQAKAAVLEIVDAERAKGRRFAGYGASVTVTTLLHHFELGSRLEYLVDDNPVKHGTLSPGHRLPVLPSEALYEKKPGAVLVLAWQYAQPIARRHAALIEAGVPLLIPLPQPEWLRK